jgi:hypothetical protein
MPYCEALEYFMAIDTLEAQETLLSLTIASSPNSKKNDREKLHKELNKKAYSHIPKKEMTTSDLASKLGIDKWQMKQQK